MELEARVAVLEELRSNDKEIINEALGELKAMRKDVHELSTNFGNSKSWTAGLVLGLSLVFVGIFEGAREIWQHLMIK